MGLLLLFLFIAIPLIEIGVFIEVGGLIGLWWTLLLVVVTAVLGTWQLRLQGLATLARARGQLDRGELPAEELFNGFCLIIAGALLLTPGFVTDALGFALFVPAFRALLRKGLARHMKLRAEVHMRGPGGPYGGPGNGPGRGPRSAPGGPDDIIDADYQEITPDAPQLEDEERRRN